MAVGPGEVYEQGVEASHAIPDQKTIAATSLGLNKPHDISLLGADRCSTLPLVTIDYVQQRRDGPRG